MDYLFWFFISSGLFLGWSLGANHAVNVFGTAVVSRMVKFKTAALIAGLFVIIGSFISGEGTTKTLNDLGAINAMAGSFTVALAVGVSVTLMTKFKLPVSTSQAIVGAIVGWNFFTGSPTDFNSLTKIFITWITSPIIAGVFAYLLFKLLKNTILKKNIHLLRLDVYTRIGLIIVGALASYSLGANNIANVMGLFVSSKPFDNINIYNVFSVSGTQQLFLLGGLAIAVGIFTYGQNVMKTVGKDMYKISPITGLIVVMAEFFVLFLFTSQKLESLLLQLGLPAIPLVPISSTQAFIGAVIGVGLAKDPHSINFKVFGKISIGWISAPIIAGLITFISLFFVQNVFEQKVVNPVTYKISENVLSRINDNGINVANLEDLLNIKFDDTKHFKDELLKRENLNSKDLFVIYKFAIVDSFKIDSFVINKSYKNKIFSFIQSQSLKKLHGKEFNYKEDLIDSIKSINYCWQKSGNILKDKNIDEKLNKIVEVFKINKLN
ncbi:MAG: anion permease [bacterium]